MEHSNKKIWAIHYALIFLVVIGILATRYRDLSFFFDLRTHEEGKEKKRWSGISYEAETMVEIEPLTSLTAEGFDSERVLSPYDDWEPAIAADPSSSYVYQMTTRYNGPPACRLCDPPVLIFRRSSDGGATWDADQFLTLTNRSQNDPMIEVANDGTIYVAWLYEYKPGVKFMKSTDRGKTWTVPIDVTGKLNKPIWSDRPVLAISPTGKDVYIALNASHSYVVTSHDYGKTFLAPVKTNRDFRYWFHSAGAVAKDGTVYFAAADFSQDYIGDVNINVLKSADGGVTWKTTRIDTSKESPDCPWAEGCYLGFFAPSIALAVDSAGKVMIAYNAGDTAGQPQKMYVRTSPDGINWNPRQEVSNGSLAVNNAFPALAAGKSPGDFRLIWQDDRQASQTGWNTWYRRTTDGGTTWNPALKISDLDSGAPYKSLEGYRFPYGDYLEIAVDANDTNHMIWGEGSSYTGPGGSWYTRGGP